MPGQIFYLKLSWKHLSSIGLVVHGNRRQYKFIVLPVVSIYSAWFQIEFAAMRTQTKSTWTRCIFILLNFGNLNRVSDIINCQYSLFYKVAFNFTIWSHEIQSTCPNITSGIYELLGPSLWYKYTMRPFFFYGKCNSLYFNYHFSEQIFIFRPANSTNGPENTRSAVVYHLLSHQPQLVVFSSLSLCRPTLLRFVSGNNFSCR